MTRRIGIIANTAIGFINRTQFSFTVIFDSIRDKAMEKFGNEDDANYYALKVMNELKDTFSLDGSRANIKKAYLQSFMSSGDVYYGSATLDFSADSMGSTISKELINPSLVDSYGTIEHSTIDNKDQYQRGEEPIIITRVDVKDDKLQVNFKLNEDSPDYEDTKSKIKNKELTHVSPEFIDGIHVGGHIFSANKIRVSLTGSPKQSNNKIIYQ